MIDKKTALAILGSTRSDEEKWEALEAVRNGQPVPEAKTEAGWPRRILAYVHGSNFLEDLDTQEEYGIEPESPAWEALSGIGYEIALYYDVTEDGQVTLVGINDGMEGELGETHRAINKKE